MKENAKNLTRIYVHNAGRARLMKGAHTLDLYVYDPASSIIEWP